MEQQYKAFVVIKILNQSKSNFDKYVCLPSTWIKVTDYYNSNVVFGYPSEDREATITRVIKYQPLDKTWPSLYGEVIHNTDSQADAYKVLRSKISLEHETEDQSNKAKSKQDDKKTTTGEVKLSSKKTKRKQTESDDMVQNAFQAKSKKIENMIDENCVEKIFEMIRSRNVTLESNNERAESPVSSSSSHKSESCETLSKETQNNVNPKKVANKENTSTHKARRSSRPKIPSDGYLGFSDEDFDTSEDSDYICSGDELISKGKPSLKSGKSKIKVSESVRPNKSILTEVHEDVKSDNADTNVTLLNEEVLTQCFNFKNFCTEFIESYQKTMSIFDNAANCLQQVITLSEKSSKASTKKPRDNDKRRKEISESEPLLDTSRYNTEDTKWTLKHPELRPGLVELLPNTGVYVTKKVLIHSQDACQDATKLARALLEDIFTEKALHVCSLTGCFPKRGKKYNIPGRPGLDLNARQTLITYAKEYGTEKNMRYADVVSITNSIKNKLQKYRKQ